MNVIMCLDDKNGMLFNKRRQSSDSELRNKIFEYINDNKLFMNDYSKKQFTDFKKEIFVSDSFLLEADSNDFCFVENTDITNFVDSVETFIIFRWNRVYPSDVKFNIELLKTFTKVENLDFKGNSHDKITMEVFKRV